MTLQYGAKRTVVRSSHTMFVATVMALLYSLDFDYVTKMRYSKDKDLVFVTKPNRLWGEKETVYEVHHLEQMVPAPVTAMKNMSQNDPTGIMTVHCMAQNENLKLYKDDKYWNSDLKNEFYAETRSLWDTTHADKYTGRIFQSRGAMPTDFALAMNKIDKEMEAAVAKHGKVTHPDNSHIDDFYDRIDKEKQNIATV